MSGMKKELREVWVEGKADAERLSSAHAPSKT